MLQAGGRGLRERDRWRDHRATPTPPSRSSPRRRPLLPRRDDDTDTRFRLALEITEEFVKYDEDLWRKASADKGLGKSA
jgi:hypothetical protein